MLTKDEAAAHLGIHASTLVRWAEQGIVMRHAYNDQAFLYEPIGTDPPIKHSSRWDRLIDRAAAIKTAKASNPSLQVEGAVV